MAHKMNKPMKEMKKGAKHGATSYIGRSTKGYEDVFQSATKKMKKNGKKKY